MKKITLSIIGALCCAVSFSQIPNWSWAKSMTTYYSHENGDYTAVDNAGNIYVATEFTQASMTLFGTTLVNPAAPIPDIYVAKFTSAGTLIWAKAFSGPSYDYINSIVTDNAGNFYLTGGFQQSITFGATTLNSAPDSGAIFIAKFDGNGNTIWAKKSTAGDYMEIQNMRVDATGNIYLAGSFSSPTLTFDNATLTYQYYNSAITNGPRAMIMKLDANGNGLWARCAQSSAETVFGSRALSIAVDNAGGVAITGRFHNLATNFGAISFTKTNTYTHSSNIFIVKYDSNGNELWGHHAGTIYENNNAGNAIAADANNNFIISGYFCNTINLAGVTLNSTTGAQFFVAKFNPSGVIQWAKSPQYSTAYSGAWSLDVDPSGNAYAAVMTFSPTMDFGNGVQLTNQGNNSLFVVRYNANGTPAWARSALGLNANNRISIDVRSQNEMYISGTYDTPTLAFGSNTITNGSTNYDLYLARLYYQPLSTTLFNADNLAFYPNPTNGIIHFDNLETEYKFQLFNNLGQCVKTGALATGNETLDLSGLQSGIYVVSLTDGEGNMVSKKVIKE